MIGNITIERKSRYVVQIRAHCRADGLSTCNRTLLYEKHPSDVVEYTRIAELSLHEAGCTEIKTLDLR